MKVKELKIEAPEGYEVDWDNSSNNVIRFKPIKKTITYQDVKEELFADCKETYYFFAGTVSKCFSIRSLPINSLLAISQQQLEQLLALNKLMNVAKYLNGDWEPDWNNKYEDKYCIYCDYSVLELRVSKWSTSDYGNVYFKSSELTRQAIEILGEEEVKKALGIFK